MKRQIQVIIAAAAIISAAATAHAENWPLFKNNALRSGTMPTETVSSARLAGQREWTTQLSTRTRSTSAQTTA